MRRTWMILWLAAAAWTVWWVRHNPLPDGYQNEYLHVGNAFDLWGAWLRTDTWHLRWYTETSYWPPGFYVLTFPLLYVERLIWETQSRLTLVLGNLVHLGLMLWAMSELGRRLRAPLAPLLLLLCPGVFGSLVRYEPNLACVAWTAAGLAMLARSEGLTARRPVLGWGLCLGLGLLMDRLSVGFYLAPPLLVMLLQGQNLRDRQVRVNVLLALGLALLICAPWYQAFFRYNAEELLSQAPVGEIDSAGQLTEVPTPAPWAWYPLALIDSQAGPVLGLLMLAGLGLAGRGAQRRERWMLAGSALGGALFFTLIAKKQVYYTLPALPALAALAACWGRPAWLGVAGGVWGFLALGLGLLPGGPWLPEALVSPRHVLARPPGRETWPIAEAVEALGPEPSMIGVFSEDESLYEGFVITSARQRWMWASVRGVTLDPQGTYEWFRKTDAFLWVGPTAGRWPTQRGIEAQLREDHYDLNTLPEEAALVVAQGACFVERGRWQTEQVDISAWRRRPGCY